jgi:hypothetical protein
MKVHPVFHISKLKKYVPNDDIRFPIRKHVIRPPPAMIDGQEEYEVEEIVDKRIRKSRTGKTQSVEYLVKWKGYPSCDNTWEPLSNLTNAKEAIEEYETAVRP